MLMRYSDWTRHPPGYQFPDAIHHPSYGVDRLRLLIGDTDIEGAL